MGRPVAAGGVARAVRTRPSGLRARHARALVEAGAYLGPSLLIFAVFVFWPLVRTLRLSFYVTDPLGRPAAFVGLAQYLRLVRPAFLNSLHVTLLFVLYVVPATILLALALAVLANLRLRRIAIFRALFSSSIAVSGATASVIFLFMYNPAIGPLNYLLQSVGLPALRWHTDAVSALPSVALTTVWLQLGLNTIILLAGMQGIPEEYYESAALDGATFFTIFRRITMPLLSPSIFFLAVVDTLSAFQTFAPFEIMTKGGPMDATNTLVYSIYREFYFNGQYGFAAAQSVVLFIIMLLLTVLQFRLMERRVFYQ
ncbi:sugar ABC transporter permease [Carboxydochorda subterranea]|uniref:Sugar ABC transporter permease n=1 Tax=Carboxydichorda subterranea TaxID=3109565 RepID=A0ABZ1BZ40_9FIRM|nr:sugar ABC transporter permease [Limnochorda sp. L945t]WRP17332.1 sugar ABC transporter permease [Limnochorda sp. L945t]